MSQISNNEDAEIDLKELLAALWSHKILIALIMGLSTFLGITHLLLRKSLQRHPYFKLNKIIPAAALMFLENLVRWLLSLVLQVQEQQTVLKFYSNVQTAVNLSLICKKSYL